MLSTAWSRIDPFWSVWSGDDLSWIRLKATADQVDIFSAEYLEQERRNLGEVDFKREYLGIPESDQASPFTWELYERATTPCTPLAPPGAAFRPQPEAPAIELPNPFRSLKPTRSCVMTQPIQPQDMHPDRPETWPGFAPMFIAHDVAMARDRSTAVVGGISPVPMVDGGHQGLSRTAAGRSLAAHEQVRSPRSTVSMTANALIVADLSNDPSYAEYLCDTFGPRVIGVQISRHGDGTNFEYRPGRPRRAAGLHGGPNIPDR